MTDDLSTLKAGDEVTVHGRTRIARRKVDRITKLHVIVGETKYRISDGNAVGMGRWDTSHITITTDADREKLQAMHLAGKLEDFPWHRLQLPTLRDVWQIVDRVADKEKP